MVGEHKMTKKEKKELRKLEWQQKAEHVKRNALYKKIGIIVGVVLIVALSVIGLIKLAGSSTDSSSSAIKVPAVSKSDITQGNPKSKVTLIEYADFQCPACASYHPLVNQLLTEFNGKIFYVYRMFPLSNIHQNAIISAQAGYAALKQNKFFQMDDYLYNGQAQWENLPNPKDTFISYAGKLKLDTAKFEADMNSSEAQNYVADSENQATSIGVNATPTFFVNGKQITNPASYDEFKKIIQDELNKK